mgnify:CR=1 FL=1
MATKWERDIKDNEEEKTKGNLDSKISRFTEKALYNLTLVDLRSICKKYHIKQGGKKE